MKYKVVHLLSPRGYEGEHAMNSIVNLLLTRRTISRANNTNLYKML